MIMKKRAFVAWSLVLLNLLTCSPGGLAAKEYLGPNPATRTLKEVTNGSSISFPIVTVDWLYVHVPYLVTFWILVAFCSLIGKWWQLIMWLPMLRKNLFVLRDGLGVFCSK